MCGFVLVELTNEFDGVYTPETKYGTKTSGFVIRVEEGLTTSRTGNKTVPVTSYLINKKVYFEGFKDDSQVKEGDKTYAFIDIKDIRGFKSE